MKKEQIKQHISNILDIGGKISFNYKGGMSHWYSDVQIYKLRDEFGGDKYILQNVPACYDFKDKDEAIEKLVERVFNENNLAIILERLKLKFNIEDFEDEGYDFEKPSKEFLKMIKDEQKLYKKENQ